MTKTEQGPTSSVDLKSGFRPGAILLKKSTFSFGDRLGQFVNDSMLCSLGIRHIWTVCSIQRSAEVLNIISRPRTCTSLTRADQARPEDDQRATSPDQLPWGPVRFFASEIDRVGTAPTTGPSLHGGLEVSGGTQRIKKLL